MEVEKCTSRVGENNVKLEPEGKKCTQCISIKYHKRVKDDQVDSVIRCAWCGGRPDNLSHRYLGDIGCDYFCPDKTSEKQHLSCSARFSKFEKSWKWNDNDDDDDDDDEYATYTYLSAGVPYGFTGNHPTKRNIVKLKCDFCGKEDSKTVVESVCEPDVNYKTFCRNATCARLFLKFIERLHTTPHSVQKFIRKGFEKTLD
jgi:hypothetical protein